MFLFVYCLFGVLYFFHFRLIINRYIYQFLLRRAWSVRTQ